MDDSQSRPEVDGPGRWARHWIVAACAIGVLFFAIQLAEIPWRSALRGYDNTFYYLWLRSLMVDGDWDFANDIEETDTLGDLSLTGAQSLPATELGRVPNKYGIGWAVLTVPAYVVADLLVLMGNRLGVWELPRDGFNAIYQICIQLWHFGLAIASLFLARRVVADWIGETWATVGVVTVWLGSSLIYYQTSVLSMSHSAAFFAVVLGAWAVQRALGSEAWFRPWLLAGAAFGLAVVTRYQLAVFGLLAVWGLWERFRSHRFDAFRCAAAGALGALPLLALQALAWKRVYGHWLVFSYGSEGEAFFWHDPAWVGSLFSAWHGLFYWHPLLFVALGGFVWWAARLRGPALALLIAVGSTIYINAAWWCWWFASAFGNRGFDAALFPLMVGQAWLFTRASERWRRVLWIVCGLLAVWNLYVFALYRSGAIARDGPVTWIEMIRAIGHLPSQVSLE